MGSERLSLSGLKWVQSEALPESWLWAVPWGADAACPLLGSAPDGASLADPQERDSDRFSKPNVQVTVFNLLMR